MAFQIQLSAGDLSALPVDVLVLLVTEEPLGKQAAIASLNRDLERALVEHARASDYKAKPEQTLEIATLGRLHAHHVVLVGLGAKKDLDEARLRTACAAAARTATGLNARAMALVPPADSDPRIIAEGVVLGAYRFTKYFTAERKPKAVLRSVQVGLGRRPTEGDKRQLQLGRKVADAVCLARDAVNEPPNELYPERLAALAREVARKNRLSVRVLDQRGIVSAGMKLIDAVGRGSARGPRFVHMSYKPRGAKKRLAFVGKGLTFDSGGLCIKPAAGMGEMKSDMGGAAAVIGMMAALGVVRPPVEVHGIIGAAENMPDGEAYRPGDVFGSLSGKTVEIVNTDAEGRLVLADALTYAQRLRPDVIVDAATLTGAAIVALGKSTTGFYATRDDLARRVERAAQLSGEGFWRMPLLDDLAEQLKSDIADLKHTGDRWGGSITAALFLREFVGSVPWVHCDIAGPAFADRPSGIHPKGGTGHPVLTFLHFVQGFTE